jgi:beta-glucanase (GH16 family)
MKQLIFALALLSHFSLTSQVLWQFNKDSVYTYDYTDGDEFNGEVPLKEKWSSWYGWARSIAWNKEQQYYSEFENHEVRDGCLYLKVIKQPVTKRLVDWMNDNDTIKDGNKFNGLNKRNFNYTSGMISSKIEYHKGYFEIKFKAPSEKGLWPAFWLYGGTPNEEIDFFELKGERPNQIHVDTHCPDRCDYSNKFPGVKRSFGGWVKLKGRLDEGFNIVSGIWDDNEIRFYMNGKFIAVSKVTFNAPKKLVINIAVAADDGPFKPGPDPKVESFSPMIIDYVRVWYETDPSDKNERKKKPAFRSQPVNIPVTNLKTKRLPRFLYGKKKEHSNEGIFISLLRTENNAELFCNGLSEGESYDLKIRDSSGKIVYSKSISDREFKVPEEYSTNTQLEVTFNNKSARYSL